MQVAAIKPNSPPAKYYCRIMFKLYKSATRRSTINMLLLGTKKSPYTCIKNRPVEAAFFYNGFSVLN